MSEPEEKPSAENLIKSVEQAYSDLRRKHPEQDEHWLLANTWLERYGNSDEAREKGPEWAKFTAYRDTCEFSILEPPESIRVLGLYSVFRELGEEQARHYESEFFQIMVPVMRSKENRVFLDEYKKKNPLTWKEVRVADNSPYSLYWFFRGLEFAQEQEEGDEGLDEDIIDILSKPEAEELDES